MSAIELIELFLAIGAKMSVSVWLVMAVVLLLLEMITPGVFLFACFSAGALLTALAVFLGAPPWLAWTVFFASSVLLVFLVAPIARRWMSGLRPTPVGLDSLEGEIALVIEPIDLATGKGKVMVSSNRAIWRATSDQPIEEGQQVRVISIIGTRLKVAVNQESLSKE